MKERRMKERRMKERRMKERRMKERFELHRGRPFTTPPHPESPS
jgi:hypothetical protein